MALTTIIRTTCNEFKIEYNGGKTWFVTDCDGDVWGSFPTERRARNEFNRILKSQNKVEAK